MGIIIFKKNGKLGKCTNCEREHTEPKVVSAFFKVYNSSSVPNNRLVNYSVNK